MFICLLFSSPADGRGGSHHWFFFRQIIIHGTRSSCFLSDGLCIQGPQKVFSFILKLCLRLLKWLWLPAGFPTNTRNTREKTYLRPQTLRGRSKNFTFTIYFLVLINYWPIVGNLYFCHLCYWSWKEATVWRQIASLDLSATVSGHMHLSNWFVISQYTQKRRKIRRGRRASSVWCCQAHDIKLQHMGREPTMFVLAWT